VVYNTRSSSNDSSGSSNYNKNNRVSSGSKQRYMVLSPSFLYIKEI
jgi:hypothetical protein